MEEEPGERDEGEEVDMEKDPSAKLRAVERVLCFLYTGFPQDLENLDIPGTIFQSWNLEKMDKIMEKSWNFVVGKLFYYQLSVKAMATINLSGSVFISKFLKVYLMVERVLRPLPPTRVIKFMMFYVLNKANKVHLYIFYHFICQKRCGREAVFDLYVVWKKQHKPGKIMEKSWNFFFKKMW